MGAIKDYLKGSNTRVTCGACGHGGSGVGGCGCPSSWCPCHKTAYGHGGHSGCGDKRHTK